MSSVGSISAVGTAPAAAGTGAQKSSGAGSVAKTGGGSTPTAGTGGVSSRGMCSNMSSNDFVTLTQKMSKNNGGLVDPKQMVNVILALELLQKVAEATGELIDKMISGK
jgi:hypothetical protein